MSYPSRGHPVNSPKTTSTLQSGFHPQQPNRALELVDALKHEVKALFEEANYSKHHRKELEAKRIMDMIY
jgi:hypothetical protein